MDYGTQRFNNNMRELTPEEKAMQELALQAIKEQARYEREQRTQLANKVKEAGAMLYKFITITILALLLAATIGCTEDKLDCQTYDLGKAGELYETVDIPGTYGTIYVDGDRIKQDICFY